MIATPCLDCSNMATRNGRCDSCRSAWNARRNARPQRAIYKGKWRATSRAARQEQGWCSLCYSTNDLTLDHTTGLVVCRSCHRSEAQGGIRKGPAFAGPERFGK